MICFDRLKQFLFFPMSFFMNIELETDPILGPLTKSKGLKGYLQFIPPTY